MIALTFGLLVACSVALAAPGPFAQPQPQPNPYAQPQPAAQPQPYPYAAPYPAPYPSAAPQPMPSGPMPGYGGPQPMPVEASGPAADPWRGGWGRERWGGWGDCGYPVVEEVIGYGGWDRGYGGWY